MAIAVKKDRFRKTITSLSTGQEYIIRRISVRNYLTTIGALPVGVAQSVQTQLKELADSLRERAKDDPEAERKTVEFALKTGVVEPMIWFGDPATCPEDQIQFDDLGDDATFLASKVYELSFDFAGLKDMEKFFRGTGAVAAGSDGEEIRAEAVETASQENIHVGNGSPGI